MSDVNKIFPFGELKSISSKNCKKPLMSWKPFKGIFSIMYSASFKSMLGKNDVNRKILLIFLEKF